MQANKALLVLGLGILTALSGAQAIVDTFPGTFVEISATGTAITGVADDSNHTIVTTVGNALFPAGSITVGNNGGVTGIGGGAIGSNLFNTDVPAAPANPSGITVGAGILMPFWDDLYPEVGASGSTLYWQQTGGVLIVEWKNDNHYADNAAGHGITFEIKVFGGATGTCVPFIQFLYADTVFGGVQGSIADSGLSATIGYAHGSLAGVGNARWSFLSASVTAGTVLSVISNPSYALTASSPSGAGSLRIDLAGGPCGGGSYILAVTLNAGLYPAGWLYGLDIPITELLSEVNTGVPFVGPIGGAGTATIGPFTGVPPITLYALGLGYPAGGSGAPTMHTQAISYAVP